MTGQNTGYPTKKIEENDMPDDWGLDGVERASVEKAIIDEMTLAEFLAEWGCDSAAKGILLWRDWIEDHGGDPNDLTLDT